MEPATATYADDMTDELLLMRVTELFRPRQAPAKSRAARQRREAARRGSRCNASPGTTDLLRAMPGSTSVALADPAHYHHELNSAAATPSIPVCDPFAVEADLADLSSACGSVERYWLDLVRSLDTAPDPETTIRLRCHYCHRVFRLQEGGAMFKGTAACSACEQHMTRDVVLPAIAQECRGRQVHKASRDRATYSSFPNENKPCGKCAETAPAKSA